MSPGDEHALSERDRAAWIAYVAPSMTNGFSLMDDDACIRSLRAMQVDYILAVIRLAGDELAARMWKLMTRDKQTDVWARLTSAEQDRVRKLRATNVGKVA